MPSAGPFFAGTAANDASIGFVAWTNTSNATGATDASFAACTYSAPNTGNYLKVTNFGFSVPTGATIQGIVVAVQKKKSAGGDDVIDQAVRIVKGGTIGATDRGTADQWPTPTSDSVPYGSASDLWGETWTAADVNASTFGAAVAPAPADTLFGAGTAQVDAVTITVTYADAGSLVPVRVARRVEVPTDPQFSE